MRTVLATICLLAFAVFVFTFVGQSAAFYHWHNASMEVRRYYPADKEAAQDFERRIWQSHPRWQEWAVIRGD